MKALLQKLGFKDNGIKVFLFCLDNENNTPTSISKGTGIKRGAVYLSLQRLENEGLIFFEIKGKKRFAHVPSPEEIREGLLTKEKKTQLEKERAINELSKQVSEKKVQKPNKSMIEHFTSRKHSQALMKRILGLKKDIYWAGNFELILEIVPPEAFFKEFTLERMKQNTTSYAMTDKSMLKRKEFSEMIGNFRQFRFFDQEFESRSLVAIIHHYVLFVTMDKNKPDILFIKNSELSKGLKFMFKSLWNRL